MTRATKEATLAEVRMMVSGFVFHLNRAGKAVDESPEDEGARLKALLSLRDVVVQASEYLWSVEGQRGAMEAELARAWDTEGAVQDALWQLPLIAQGIDAVGQRCPGPIPERIGNSWEFPVVMAERTARKVQGWIAEQETAFA